MDESTVQLTMLGGISIFRKGKTVKSSQKDIIYSMLMPTKKNHLQ
jgi:hypothetical protein